MYCELVGHSPATFHERQWPNRINLPYYLSLSVCLSLYLCLCVCLSLSLSVFPCLCVSASPCVSLSLSVSPSLCLRLFVCLSMSLSLSLFLSVCVCLSLFVSLSVSLCLYVYLSVFLTPPPPPPLTPHREVVLFIYLFLIHVPVSLWRIRFSCSLQIGFNDKCVVQLCHSFSFYTSFKNDAFRNTFVLKCYFTSPETIRTIRDRDPRTSTSPSTQLLSCERRRKATRLNKSIYMTGSYERHVTGDTTA